MKSSAKKTTALSPTELSSWKCQECGCPANLTPMLRPGPFGKKTICNACYIRQKVAKERAMRGSARPNLAASFQPKPSSFQQQRQPSSFHPASEQQQQAQQQNTLNSSYYGSTSFTDLNNLVSFDSFTNAIDTSSSNAAASSTLRPNQQPWTLSPIALNVSTISSTIEGTHQDQDMEAHIKLLNERLFSPTVQASTIADSTTTLDSNNDLQPHTT